MDPAYLGPLIRCACMGRSADTRRNPGPWTPAALLCVLIRIFQGKSHAKHLTIKKSMEETFHHAASPFGAFLAPHIWWSPYV
jgi:hypothetical protein